MNLRHTKNGAILGGHPVFCVLYYAPSPLDPLLRSFPLDGEVANLLRTCFGLVMDLF